MIAQEHPATAESAHVEHIDVRERLPRWQMLGIKGNAEEGAGELANVQRPCVEVSRGADELK